MSDFVRSSLTYATLLVTNAVISGLASANIVSSGDVKPPFALTGPSSSFTVPVAGSTSGGAIVGDVATGALTIDGAWTLNTTYGIIGNGVNSGTSNPSGVVIAGGSIWNLSLDLDVGNGAAATAQLQTGSSVNARAVRIATLAGSSGTFDVNSSSSINTSSGTFVGEGGSASMSVSVSSTLTTAYLVVADQINSSGVAQFSGASHLYCAGGAIIGGRGQGSLSLSSASTSQVGFTSIGYDPDAPQQSSTSPSDNQLLLSGANTFYDNTEGFFVGYNTKGSATIESGARLDAGFLDVSTFGDDGALSIRSGAHVNLRPAGAVPTPSLVFASAPGSVAIGTIADAGSVVNVNATGAFAEIGRRGSAAVTVSNGAVVNADISIVATEPGSVGTLTVSGSGSAWNSSSPFEVGRAGVAFVNVTGGAVVTATSSIMATEAGSDGTLLVSGSGSAWNTNGSFEIGRGGDARLTVQSGGAFTTSQFLLLGSNPNSSGNLVIDGGGAVPASATSSAQGVFGGHGGASVVVQNAGRLTTLKAASPTSSSGILSQFDDSSSSVTVRGAGSLWSGDGGLNVGFRGQGTLSIATGGRVDCADGIIARLAGSVGNVSLSDANSKWVISNSLYVGGRPASSVAGVEGQAGPGGAASLSVGSGASITVGSTLRLFSAGTIDLVPGGSIAVGSTSAAAASTLRIFAGGTLFGSGLVKGALVNEGQLNPGNSTGTLSVTGTLLTAGTMNFEINTPTDFDKIALGGAATLGGTLALMPAPGLNLLAGQRLDVLTAGAVSGQFSTVTGNRIDATHWLALLKSPTKLSLALAVSGDATLDGIVNFDDLLILAQNYGQSGPNFDWKRGNFDGNTSVNFDDLLALAQHYGQSALQPSTTRSDFAADWALAQALVPEPVSFSLVAALGLFGIGRPPRAGSATR